MSPRTASSIWDYVGWNPTESCFYNRLKCEFLRCGGKKYAKAEVMPEKTPWEWCSNLLIGNDGCPLCGGIREAQV